MIAHYVITDFCVLNIFDVVFLGTLNPNSLYNLLIVLRLDKVCFSPISAFGRYTNHLSLIEIEIG